jgi:uncharacterized protein involved in response to NO
MQRLRQEPFRLFFPLAAVLALMGISPWLMQLFPNAPFPADYHRHMMINGFFLAFTVGYFLTKITPIPNNYEFFIAAAFMLAATFCNLTNRYQLHYLFVGLTLQNLLFFSLRRRNTLAFMSIFVWAMISFLFAIDRWLMEWRPVLFLISTSGVPAVILLEVFHGESKHNESKILTSAFLLSYFIKPYGAFLRTLIVLYYGFNIWKIQTPPKIKNGITWGLWFAGWFFIIGNVLTLLWSQEYVAGLHATLIGTFSLSILLFSLYTVKAPDSSRSITWMNSLVLTAAATRVFAPVIPRIYHKHLGYSALLWIIGFTIWAFAYAKKR